MKSVLWNNTPLEAQHYVNSTSGMQGLRGNLHHLSLTFSLDEKLLCGLLKELWAGHVSGHCFAVHIILSLNSPSSQFYEAVSTVRELHLCGYICVDDTPVSA